MRRLYATTSRESSMTLKRRKSTMTTDLRESFDAYWPAFTQLVRSARNDAGHPASVAAVGEGTAHSSLLVFPEILRLGNQLEAWIKSDMK